MKIFIEIIVALANKLDVILIYSAIPILLTFALERFFIYRLSKSASMQKWVDKTFWLQPNNISRFRYFAGLITVAVYHYFSPVLAIYLWGFWAISDITDGSIAKILKKQSALGEIIDPLSDKLLYLPTFFYAAFYLHLVEKNLVLMFAFVDIIGQLSRTFSKVKAANLFGKIKTFLCALSLIIIFGNDYYFQNSLPLTGISEFLMVVLIILAFCSIFFRIIPNYWYANILSILNLACGVSSIFLIVTGHPLVYGFLLIFVGQFLDLLDGRAALKWGSTPIGAIIDDVSDGVNFGIAVAFIIYYSISSKPIALLASVLYCVCTIFRLYRFAADKRKDAKNNAQNYDLFKGLPSPAAALFAGSSFVLLNDFYINFLPYHQIQKDWVTALLAIFTGGLMISKIPYIHAGRVLMKKTPNIFKVLTFSLLIFSCSIGFGINDYTLLMLVILVFAVFYIFFGQNKQPKQN